MSVTKSSSKHIPKEIFIASPQKSIKPLMSESLNCKIFFIL